jgi:hypothetical protein
MTEMFKIPWFLGFFKGIFPGSNVNFTKIT